MATRDLALSMNRAATEIDATIGDVNALLQLAQLESDTPAILVTEAEELEKVGLVLHARADLVEGFTIDIDALAKQLDIPKGQVEAAVNTISTAEPDSGADPLLTLVADHNYLFSDAPTSIRDVLIGLPPEGEDPTLDAAIDRIDEPFLNALLNGESVGLDVLSEQQRSDLTVVAAALGADQLLITVEREVMHSDGQTGHFYETESEQVALTELGPGAVRNFLITQLNRDDDRRRSTTDLIRATERIDRNNLDREAAELGVSKEELSATLATVDLMAAANDGNVRGIDTGAVTDASFPDRNDFPEGEEGDRAYIEAVEQDRLDAVKRGDNVVGPVGSEQDAFYEAMGSVFGSQNFAFSHDYQATQAEIQNRNDPGWLGVDIPNAVTATVGYAAAVVTAPAVAAINSVFGTAIDVAVVGTAIADLGWSAFGYDVEAPTIAESLAKEQLQAQQKAKEEKEKAEKERQLEQDRRDFDNDSDRRDNLAREGHDPSIRDDDFSGDQNTGGNGLL